MTTDEHNVQLEINHRHPKSTAKPLKNPAEMWLQWTKLIFVYGSPVPIWP